MRSSAHEAVGKKARTTNEDNNSQTGEGPRGQPGREGGGQASDPDSGSSPGLRGPLLCPYYEIYDLGPRGPHGPFEAISGSSNWSPGGGSSWGDHPGQSCSEDLRRKKSEVE